MERELYESLLLWKSSKNRKPLLLQGARQVGKTYLIKEFGKKEYDNYVFLNFEQNSDLESLFKNLVPEKIIENIEYFYGEKISSSNTLLFFDEIQTAPNVLTSLKYFYEELPEYHIIAAGSLLGVSIGKTNSFPVGKVNFLSMQPMSFHEFLEAIDEKSLVELLNKKNDFTKIPEIIHNKLIEKYKLYLFVGGMPEVVKTYINDKDLNKVRQVQNEILKAYKKDFSKYASKQQAIKTSEFWHSIPNQLAKENKKFKYSDVKKKGRASMFEQTIEWLKGAGLINIVVNISKPELPLSGYTDSSKFKVFLLDTGLLGAMLKLEARTIINQEEIFKKYNGAFIENFVAQELSLCYDELYYWTSAGQAEVDFILQKQAKVFPLEVKSGTSLNMKSMNSYVQKYKPDYYYRCSPRNFILSNGFRNIPLYALKNIC